MRSPRSIVRDGAEICVEGADIPRFLRSCAQESVYLENVRAERPFVIRATLRRRDLPRAEAAAEKSGCGLTVAGYIGLPRYFRRARRRLLLTALLLLGCGGLLFSSLFIWSIRVTDNPSNVPDGEILRVLRSQGVGVGTFWPGLHADLVRNRALLSLPELDFLTVNVEGSRALVQVRQTVPAPALWDPRKPVDIISSCSGVITRMTVLEGTPLLHRGDAVQEGQVLISADKGALGKTVHAAGRVTAQTRRVLTAAAPLCVEEKTPSGRPKYRLGLVLGEKIYFFSQRSGILPRSCDKIIKIKTLRVGDFFSLPLGLALERVQAYSFSPRLRSPEELRADMEAELRAVLSSEIGEEGEVIASAVNAHAGAEVFTLTLTAQCSERIDREHPR